MFGRVFDFLLGGSLWGNVTAAALGGAVLVGAWQWDKVDYGNKRATIARQDERARTEKANDKVVRNADRVRARVRDDRVRGIVDPHYID